MDRLQELIDKEARGRLLGVSNFQSYSFSGAGLYFVLEVPYENLSLGIFRPDSIDFLRLSNEEVYAHYTSRYYNDLVGFSYQWVKLYESIEVEKSLEGVFHG